MLIKACTPKLGGLAKMLESKNFLLVLATWILSREMVSRFIILLVHTFLAGRDAGISQLRY